MAPRDYDQRLDDLLSNAAKVFAERGYHPTSMRDLSKETGVSLSGLYYYVDSKEELLFLIQQRSFGQVLDAAREALAEVSRPIDRLGAFIESHLDFFASHMSEMKVLSHESGSLTGDFLAKVNDQKRQYTLLLMDILEELEHSNGPAHLSRRVAAYSLFGMMNWIYNWYNPLGDIDIRVLAQNMTRLFLGGYVGHPVAEAALPHSTAG